MDFVMLGFHTYTKSSLKCWCLWRSWCSL